VPQLPLLSMFTFGLIIESIKELGGASPLVQNPNHNAMIEKRGKNEWIDQLNLDCHLSKTLVAMQGVGGEKKKQVHMSIEFRSPPILNSSHNATINTIINKKRCLLLIYFIYNSHICVN